MTLRTHTTEAKQKPTEGRPVMIKKVLVGDVRDRLTEIPDSSVDCIVTSPPYFRLRNYQHDAQLGLEAHVDMWVEELRSIGTELSRVLKPSGSLWLNLGDSYSRTKSAGAPNKSLLLAPEKVALAFQQDGWILPNKVIWAKSNPLPSSVGDRLSCTYEIVYFFTKSSRYFFDLDAIRERPSQLTAGSSPDPVARARYLRDRRLIKADRTVESWRGPLANTNSGLDALKAQGLGAHPLGKNPGDVWRLATSNYRSIHHATFPPSLVERPIQATCPERVCADCGEPWTRTRAHSVGHLALLGDIKAQCKCEAGSKPGVVLDPFIGSGTTALAAEAMSRDWIGIEINKDFARLATRRIEA
jgi:site-specific DNA-methyltransferase (adenine-specific)